MFRWTSPHGTRQRQTGRLVLLALAALIAVAALRLLRPAEELPAAAAGSVKEAPRSKSGYENRALWRGPARPDARVPPITGTVYDLDGNRLAGAVVKAVTFQIAGNQPAEAGSVKTDGIGRFELPLPAGSYYVSGDMAGYGPARLIAHSGDEVGLVLARSGVITGRVTDEQGRPVQRFSIDVIGPMPEDFAASAPFVSRRFDSADGTFRIDQLPDQPVTLRATAPEYAPRVSDVVQARPGDTLTVDLRLGSGCTLSGVVEDERGAPLPDVFIDAELMANAGVLGPASIDAVSQADSDAAGRFTLEHVPVGDVQIRAYDGAHAVTTASLHVDDCGAATPVTLRMSPGSDLSGKVLASSGEPVPGARVTLMHRSIGFVTAVSDVEGRYRFTRLPAGGMRLEAALGEQRAATLVQVPGDGAEERDIVFAAKGTGEIRGRVTAGQRPLAGLQLMVVTHQGRGVLDTVYPVTDMDGAYRVTGLSPGAYGILVMSASKVTPVTLRSDTTETVDIDLAAKPQVPELSEELKEKLRQMQEETAAQGEETAPPQ